MKENQKKNAKPYAFFIYTIQKSLCIESEWYWRARCIVNNHNELNPNTKEDKRRSKYEKKRPRTTVTTHKFNSRQQLINNGNKL